MVLLLNFNLGDILVQFIGILMLLAVMYIIFRVGKNAFSSKNETNNSKSMEEKLDKIIELLEKEKKS